ncbi:MAG: thioredoxin domain-containing protein [Candidatus Diapherotrites archaeon]|nr:thioredoxin domain-containing protein [Candidatus Diapherotrites archaeon]
MKWAVFLVVMILISGFVLADGVSSTSVSGSTVSGATEQVTCLFNSSDAQECHSEFGSCTGTGSCAINVSGVLGQKIEWKSSCGGYAYSIIDGTNENIKFDCSSTPSEPTVQEILTEQIKCVFNNSTNATEECYSDYGKCDGNPACVVDVKGQSGSSVIWKSTCGGYAFTKIDGSNEYAIFECGSTPTNPPVLADEISETVKCLFNDTPQTHKCYTTRFSDRPNEVCSGTDSCTVGVKGIAGEQLVWKSSCGGYGYTTFDGKTKYVKFDCLNQVSIISEKVKCIFSGASGEQKCYTQKNTITKNTATNSNSTSTTSTSSNSSSASAIGTSSTTNVVALVRNSTYLNEGGACSGIGSCVADVSGIQGQELSWTSSCGENFTTTVDGQDEAIKFDCSNNEQIISEQVKCLFVNSTDSSQACYSEYGSCKGSESCVADVKGQKSTGVIWKSSCGGYAYTTIDGQTEYAKFDCSATEPPKPPVVNSKVLIEEYSDFSCPYCGQFNKSTKPLIEKEFGNKVSIVFKQFPLSFHQYAQKAAEASECARDQGQFEDYASLLFTNQKTLDIDSLKTFAAKLGLDTAKFNTCLDNGDMVSRVKDDYSQGVAKGITGTPTFIMANHTLEGAQTIDAFRKAINEELLGGGIPLISETVGCIFKGATSENKCYATDYEQYPEVFCKGNSDCKVDVKGAKGNIIDFYSSCNSNDKYSHKINLDGQNEILTFDCTGN